VFYCVLDLGGWTGLPRPGSDPLVNFDGSTRLPQAFWCGDVFDTFNSNLEDSTLFTSVIQILYVNEFGRLIADSTIRDRSSPENNCLHKIRDCLPLVLFE
jgi:hypothetical protein